MNLKSKDKHLITTSLSSFKMMFNLKGSLLLGSISGALLVAAAGPKVIKTETFKAQFNSPGGGTSPGGVYDIVYAVSTFDKPIFYKNPVSGIVFKPEDLIGSTTFTMPNNGGGGGGGGQPPQPLEVKIPLSAIYGYGSGFVKCGSQIIPPFQPMDITNLALKSIVGAPTEAPLSTWIMNSYGFALNETITANQHIVMVAVGFNGNIQIQDSQISSSCKLVYPTAANLQTLFPPVNASKTFLIVDSDGTAVDAPTEVSIAPPNPSFNCTEKGMNDLLQVYKQAMALANEISNVDDFANLDFLISSINTRPVFENCKKLIQAFYNISVQPMQIKAGKRGFCPYRPDQNEWNFDPCCNYALTQYQCCLPKPRTIMVPMVNEVKTDKVTKQCNYAAQIIPLLYEFIDIVNKGNNQQDIDVGDLFEEYYSFYDTCRSKVFEQSCTGDSQCFSGKCDTEVSGNCIVKWGEEHKSLIACYLEQMPTDLRLELQAQWKLKATYSNDTEIKDVFENEFKNRLFSSDCVGPQSEPFRSKEIFVKGKDGFGRRVVVPGNETGCLQQKKCNYREWENNNIQKCTNVGQLGFCAACYGSMCRDVTQYPSCVINSLNGNQAGCAAAGGNYSIQFNQCQILSNTIDECFAGTACNGMPSLYPACQRDQCIKVVANQTECASNKFSGLPVQYASAGGTNYCLIWNAQKNTCETNFGGQFYYGRWFTEGTYYTKAQCDKGMCNVPSLYGKEVDKTTCESTSYCTKPCAECQGPTSCIKSGVANQDDCKAQGGRYENNVCRLNAQNSSACVSQGGTFLACTSFSNKDTCLQGTAGLGKCNWNLYGNCKTKEQCEGNGECDDFDFQPVCFGGAPCNATGVCFKAINQTDGKVECKIGERRVRLGCIQDTIKTIEGCNALGSAYKWVSRAKSKAECDAQGVGCKEKGRFDFSMKNSTECTACGGVIVPRFKWNAGKWINGTQIGLSYMNRSWVSVNEWKSTLDYSKLNGQVSMAVAKIIARQKLISINKRYSAMYAFMGRAACACGSDKDINKKCFGNITSTNVATCRADPGIESECEGITFGNETISFNTSVTVSVDIVSGAGSTSDNTTQSSDGKASIADVSAFAVVKKNALVVGQLVGNGKSFTVTGGLSGAIQVCLDVNPSIPQANEDYPKADFVKLNSDNTLSEPLELEVSDNGATLCGTVSGEGTFYPVIRKANFNSGGDGSSGTTTNAGSSGTTTNAGSSGTATNAGSGTKTTTTNAGSGTQSSGPAQTTAKISSANTVKYLYSMILILSTVVTLMA